jgi:hypothetical protein
MEQDSEGEEVEESKSTEIQEDTYHITPMMPTEDEVRNYLLLPTIA